MEELFVVFGILSLSLIILAYLTDMIEERRGDKVRNKKPVFVKVEHREWGVSHVSRHTH